MLTCMTCSLGCLDLLQTPYEPQRRLTGLEQFELLIKMSGDRFSRMMYAVCVVFFFLKNVLNCWVLEITGKTKRQAMQFRTGCAFCPDLGLWDWTGWGLGMICCCLRGSTDLRSVVSLRCDETKKTAPYSIFHCQMGRLPSAGMEWKEVLRTLCSSGMNIQHQCCRMGFIIDKRH